MEIARAQPAQLAAERDGQIFAARRAAQMDEAAREVTTLQVLPKLALDVPRQRTLVRLARVPKELIDVPPAPTMPAPTQPRVLPAQPSSHVAAGPAPAASAPADICAGAESVTANKCSAPKAGSSVTFAIKTRCSEASLDVFWVDESCHEVFRGHRGLRRPWAWPT
jgi:hypothetical protein